MMRRLAMVLVLSLFAGSLQTLLAAEPNANEFSGKLSWSIPAPDAIQEQLTAWLDNSSVDDAIREQIKTVWAAQVGNESTDALEILATSFALADPRAEELVELCSQPWQLLPLPDFTWLADEDTAEFERHNLRLYLARWMVRYQLYEEAGHQLEGLEPNQVVDPAALLFHQAIVYQQMLKKDEGLASIERLLEKDKDLPKRYQSLAKLMQADLQQLKDDSLDHISRRMDDVERRLDLGRAGPKTREVEDGVIKSLDKLIKDLEDQAAAAAAAAGAQGSLQPSTPANESRPMGGQGPGQVAKKDIGNQSGWGELPPKQRQEALQEIGKDYPAHYRDMIEQYFRKLATEESQP